MYYTAELQNAASFRNPEPTHAKTLAGAKRAASLRQTFQGTTLAVYDSTGHKIAVKQDLRDWADMDGERLNCAPDFIPECL